MSEKGKTPSADVQRILDALARRMELKRRRMENVRRYLPISDRITQERIHRFDEARMSLGAAKRAAKGGR